MALKAAAAVKDKPLRIHIIEVLAESARQDQPALWRQWREKQIAEKKAKEAP